MKLGSGKYSRRLLSPLKFKCTFNLQDMMLFSVSTFLKQTLQFTFLTFTFETQNILVNFEIFNMCKHHVTYELMIYKAKSMVSLSDTS